VGAAAGGGRGEAEELRRAVGFRFGQQPYEGGRATENRPSSEVNFRCLVWFFFAVVIGRFLWEYVHNSRFYSLKFWP